MDEEQKRRLIGEALVDGFTFLGKADRFFSRFGAFIIIFIFGLMAGYAWAFWHYHGPAPY